MDMGTCKAMIADGSRSCKRIVNLSKDDAYCPYHLPAILKARYNAAMAVRNDLNQQVAGPSHLNPRTRSNTNKRGLSKTAPVPFHLREQARAMLFREKNGVAAIRKETAANRLPSRATLTAQKNASTPKAVSEALLEAAQREEARARARKAAQHSTQTDRLYAKPISSSAHYPF